MEKVISVIIPVYNVEKYLPTCMESVLGQTYPALEVILIDDGSTDSSGRLCDQYAAKDSRVRVIHQKNAGAGAAKNTGLRAATGEYLAFLDSDDYLETDAYEHMVSLLEQSGAEVVQCSFRNVFVTNHQDVVTLPQRQEFTVREYLLRFTTDWTCGMMTEKLYQRWLFDGIFFEEGNVIDDDYFTYQGIMNCQKVIRDPKVIYNYRQRKSSVTVRTDYRERTITDRLDYLVKRKKKISQRFPELKKAFDLHYLRMLLWLSEDPWITQRSLKQIQTAAEDYLADRGNTRPSWGMARRLKKLRKASYVPTQGQSPAVEDMSNYYD